MLFCIEALECGLQCCREQQGPSAHQRREETDSRPVQTGRAVNAAASVERNWDASGVEWWGRGAGATTEPKQSQSRAKGEEKQGCMCMRWQGV